MPRAISKGGTVSTWKTISRRGYQERSGADALDQPEIQLLEAHQPDLRLLHIAHVERLLDKKVRDQGQRLCGLDAVGKPADGVFLDGVRLRLSVQQQRPVLYHTLGIRNPKIGSAHLGLALPQGAFAGKPASDVGSGEADIPARGHAAEPVHEEDGPEDAPPLLCFSPAGGRIEKGHTSDQSLTRPPSAMDAVLLDAELQLFHRPRHAAYDGPGRGPAAARNLQSKIQRQEGGAAVYGATYRIKRNNDEGLQVLNRERFHAAEDNLLPTVFRNLRLSSLVGQSGRMDKANAPRDYGIEYIYHATSSFRRLYLVSESPHVENRNPVVEIIKVELDQLAHKLRLNHIVCTGILISMVHCRNWRGTDTLSFRLGHLFSLTLIRTCCDFQQRAAKVLLARIHTVWRLRATQGMCCSPRKL